MDEFTTSPLTPELSDEEVLTRMQDTIMQYNLLRPDATMDDTIDTLWTEFLEYEEQGRFTAETGLEIQPFDEQTSDVKIPSTLGFNERGQSWAIHFTPPLTVLDSEGDKLTPKTQYSEQSQENQKYLAMSLGMAGALNYITLVEAGLIPRPDNIIGITNPVMARFSERTGLSSASKVASEMAKSYDSRPLSKQDETHKKSLVNDAIDSMYNGVIGKDYQAAATMVTLELAAKNKREGKDDLYQALVAQANAFMLSSPYSLDDDTVVWGSYESFRDGVLELKDKFGVRVQKMATREMAALGV
jgi:hypothetical protein